LAATDANKATTVERLLDEARSELTRLSPKQAHEALAAGAILIDIRSEAQQARDGEVPGAHSISRNVLEWRLDPTCRYRDASVARRDRRVILLCDEGYQSSLAAATLCRFGLQASDVIGGFQAWRAADLPVRRTDSESPRS
jgi:rhodanese-related sulfurtransferase